MLFPLAPGTPESQIFTALNNELLHFIESSIEIDEFNRGLFSDGVGQACWDNQPTKDKFEALWNVLPHNSDNKRVISEEFRRCQDVELLFRDRAVSFPQYYSDELKVSLKALTVHLFNNTKDLAGVKAVCGNESLNIHFQNFCALNGRLCQTCGIRPLSDPRANVGKGEQWRSAYDHILSKDKHPMYGIHPRNLVPLCDICNSKAKGARDLLLDHSGRRRLALNPFDESCMGIVTVTLQEHPDELVGVLDVNWRSDDLDQVEKLEAWNDIYQVKSRVEGIDSDYVLKLNDQLDQPIDLDDFKSQLARKARQPHIRALREEPMMFWRHKLYEWLARQQDDFIESIWEMILQRRDDDGYGEVYEV